MKQRSLRSINYSDSLLSAFDIGGSLPLSMLQSKGIDQDMQQLSADRKVLEEDYQKACDKVASDLRNSQ